MKRLTFDKILIELTRKCNMTPACRHCFRGEQQDVTIEDESIDNLLKQTEIIGSVFFTGGEPTLAIQKMQYFLEQLYKNSIPLFNFEMISNGLIYDENVIHTIKDYSDFIKMCCEVINPNVDIAKHVVFGISIDKYHNNRHIAESNLNKYKKALQGYAQVVKVAQGNTPRKEGNGKHLIDGLCDLGFEETINKRIEILDKDHKPRCPQYKTYRLIKPEQVKICCDLYLSAKGDLLILPLGLHEYCYVDFEKCHICNVNSDDIYDSILQYNKGKIDCLSLIKINSTKAKSKPFEYLFTNLHDFMYLMNHKFEDDSDTIKRDLSPDHIDLSKLNQAAVLDNTLIDKMILSAESFNYNRFNT